MGRLSPFRDSTLFGLAVLALFFMPNYAAPVQETSLSRYANDKGCFFMNKHYPSGHEIETNEPCLNCTCVGSTLMCYLRVCPFIKPLGENCKSEQHVGDCCPKYWCPEVYPRLTTEKPDTESKGCFLHGRYYEEGARIPMDPMKPCEACYCIRNTSVCTLQKCELEIDGCYPQYKVGSCCPSRYNCTDEAATTIPPGILEAEEYEGCKVDGVIYKDGEHVPSENKCKNCYCMKHEVVCAIEECTPPAPNCVPQETPTGQCCPEKYDCPDGTEIPDSATVHMVTTEEELLNFTTTSEMLTTASLSDISEEDMTSVESAETMLPTTKGIRRIDDEELISTVSVSEASTVSVSEEELLNFTTTSEMLTTASLSDISEEDMTSVESAETMLPTTKGIRRIDDEELISTVSVSEAELSTTESALNMTDSRPRVPKITEIPEELFTTVPNITTRRPVFFPSRPIPGEGICRHENRTYQNKEKVISSDPCSVNCSCLNSVVHCDFIECTLVPPESGVNCKVKKKPDECCPEYVCDIPPRKPGNETDAQQQQQEVFDTYLTTPEVKQEEITTVLFESSTSSEISEHVTTSHKPQEESTKTEITSTILPPKSEEEGPTTHKILSTVPTKLPEEERTTETMQLPEKTETPHQKTVSESIETTRVTTDIENITEPISILITTSKEMSDDKPQFTTDITTEIPESKTTIVAEAETVHESISTIKTTIESELMPHTPSTIEEKVETTESLESEVTEIKDTKITTETLPILTDKSTTVRTVTPSSTLKDETEAEKISTKITEASTISIDVKPSEVIASTKPEAETATFSSMETTSEPEIPTGALVTDAREILENKTSTSEITPVKDTEGLKDGGFTIDSGMTSSDKTSSVTPEVSDKVFTLIVTTEADTKETSREEISGTTSSVPKTDTKATLPTEGITSKGETTMQTVPIIKESFEKDITKLIPSTEQSSESTLITEKLTPAASSSEESFTMSTEMMEKLTTTTTEKKKTEEETITPMPEKDLSKTTLLQKEVTTDITNISSMLTTLGPMEAETSFETIAEDIRRDDNITLTSVQESEDKLTSETELTSPEVSTIASTSFYETSSVPEIGVTIGKEKTDLFTTYKTKTELIETDMVSKEGLETTAFIDELSKTTGPVKLDDVKTETASQAETTVSLMSDTGIVTDTTELLITQNITSSPTSETKHTPLDSITPKLTLPEHVLSTETVVTEVGTTMTTEREKEDVEITPLKTVEVQELTTVTSKEEAIQKYSTQTEKTATPLKTTEISPTDEKESVTSSVTPEALNSTIASVSTISIEIETVTYTDLPAKEIVTAVSTLSEKGETLKPVTTEIPFTQAEEDKVTVTPLKEGENITVLESEAEKIATTSEEVTTTAKQETTVKSSSTISEYFKTSTEEDVSKFSDVYKTTVQEMLSETSPESSSVFMTTESALKTTKTSKFEILSSEFTYSTLEAEQTTLKPKTSFVDVTESFAPNETTTKVSVTEIITETVPSENISISTEVLVSEVTISTEKDEAVIKETTVPSILPEQAAVTDLTSTEKTETELQTRFETLSTTAHTSETAPVDTERLTTPTKLGTTLPEKEIETVEISSEISSSVSIATGYSDAIPTTETLEILRDVSTQKPVLTDSTLEQKITSKLPELELASKGTTVETTAVKVATDSEKSSYDSEISTLETRQTGTEEFYTKLEISTSSPLTTKDHSLTTSSQKEITTPLRTDVPVTSAETISTEEVEISTDNLFTTFKHTPESLLKDKTSTQEAESTTFTLAPKITDSTTTRETLKSSPQEETYEAETSTPTYLTSDKEMPDSEEEFKTHMTEEGSSTVKLSSYDSTLTEKFTVPKFTGTTSLHTERITTEMPLIDTTKLVDIITQTATKDVEQEATESETTLSHTFDKTVSTEVSKLGTSIPLTPETEKITTEAGTTLKEEDAQSTLSESSTEFSKEFSTLVSEQEKTDLTERDREILPTKELHEDATKSTFVVMDTTASIKPSVFVDEGETSDIVRTSETSEKTTLTTKASTDLISITKEAITKLTPVEDKFLTTESTSSTSILGFTESEKISESSTTTKSEISKSESTEAIDIEVTTQYISTKKSTTPEVEADKVSEIDHFETTSVRSTEKVETQTKQDTTTTKEIKPSISAETIVTETETHGVVTQPEHKLTGIETSTVFVEEKISTSPSDIQDLEKFTSEEMKEKEISKATESSTLSELEISKETKSSTQATFKDVTVTSTVADIALIDESEETTVKEELDVTKILVKDTSEEDGTTKSSTLFELTEETKPSTHLTSKDASVTSTDADVALTEKTPFEEGVEGVEVTKVSSEGTSITMEGEETATFLPEFLGTTLSSLNATDEKTTSLKETTDEEIKSTMRAPTPTESVTKVTTKTEKVPELIPEIETSTLLYVTASIAVKDAETSVAETTKEAETHPTTSSEMEEKSTSFKITEEKVSSLNETTDEDIKSTMRAHTSTESVTELTIKTEKVPDVIPTIEASTLLSVTDSTTMEDTITSVKPKTSEEAETHSTTPSEIEEKTTDFELTTPEKVGVSSTVDSKSISDLSKITTDIDEEKQLHTTISSETVIASETTTPADYQESTNITTITESHTTKFMTTTATSEEVSTFKIYRDKILTSTEEEKSVTEIPVKETKVSSTEAPVEDIHKKVSDTPITTIEGLMDNVTTKSVLEDELKSTKPAIYLITDHTTREEKPTTLIADSESTELAGEIIRTTTSFDIESKPTEFTDKHVSLEITEQYDTETVSEEFPSTFITTGSASESDERVISSTLASHEAERTTTDLTADYEKTKLTSLPSIIPKKQTTFIDMDLASQFTTVSSGTSVKDTTLTSKDLLDETEVSTSSPHVDLDSETLSTDMVTGYQTELTDSTSSVITTKDISHLTTDKTLKETDIVTSSIDFDKEQEENISTTVTTPSSEIIQTEKTVSETSSHTTPSRELTTTDHEQLTTEIKQEKTTSSLKLSTQQPELIPTTLFEMKGTDSTEPTVSSLEISETPKVEGTISVFLNASELPVSTEGETEKISTVETILKEKEITKETTIAAASSTVSGEGITLKISSISDEEMYSSSTPDHQISDKGETEISTIISESNTEITVKDDITSPVSTVKVPEATGIFDITGEKTEVSEVSEALATTTESTLMKTTMTPVSQVPDTATTTKIEFKITSTETKDLHEITEKTLIEIEETKSTSTTDVTETSEAITKTEASAFPSTDKEIVSDFVTDTATEISKTSLIQEEITSPTSISLSQTVSTEHDFTTQSLESQTAEDVKVSKELVDVEKTTISEAQTSEAVTDLFDGKEITLKADTSKPELQTTKSVLSTDTTKESSESEKTEGVTISTSLKTETSESVKTKSTDAVSLEAESVTTELSTESISDTKVPEVSILSTELPSVTTTDVKELTKFEESSKDTKEPHLTTEEFKVTSSSLEKEITTAISIEAQSTESVKTSKTDISKTHLAPTTEMPYFEKTTETGIDAEVSSTKKDIAYYTTSDESIVSDETTTSYQDNKTEISIVYKTKETEQEEFSTPLATKSYESTKFSDITKEYESEPTEFSKKVTTTKSSTIDITTELSSYSPELTTKISADTEETQTKESEIVSTSAKEFSETLSTAVVETKEETTKTPVSAVEITSADATDKTTTKLITIAEITEKSKEEITDMFKETETTKFIDLTDRISSPLASSTTSAFTTEESEKITSVKILEGETTESSLEVTTLMLETKTEKLSPKVPDIVLETDTVTESSPVITTKPTDLVSVSSTVESDVTPSETVSTAKSTEKLVTEMVKAITDTETTASLRESVSTSILSDIGKTNITKILADVDTTTPLSLKPIITKSTTEKPDIAILDEKSSTMITEIANISVDSTAAPSSEKVTDSETTVKSTTKAELLLSTSTETRAFFTSDLLDTTTSEFTIKESDVSIKDKMTTLEAEISSPSTVTEHTVITEETILSNVTFAADAMIGTQRTTTLLPTGFLVSNDSSSTIVSEVSEYISTMTPPSTDILRESVSQTRFSQDIDSKDIISVPSDSETTPYTSLSTEGTKEAVTEIIPKETTKEKLHTVTKEPITTGFTESLESKNISTLLIYTDKTLKTTETPEFSTSKSIEEGISLTTSEILEIEKFTDAKSLPTGSSTGLITDGITPTTILKMTNITGTLPSIIDEKITAKDKLLTTERMSTDIVETTFVSTEISDLLSVPSSTSQPQEAETASGIPSLGTTESAKESTLKVESPLTTISEKDKITVTSPEVTEPIKITDEKTTIVVDKETEFTSFMTANDTTITEDYMKVQTPEIERDTTLRPIDTITTLHTSHSSDLYPDSELPEGFYSRRDQTIHDVTTSKDEMLETISTIEGVASKATPATEEQILERVTTKAITETTLKSITSFVNESTTDVSSDMDSKLTKDLEVFSTSTKQIELSTESSAFTETPESPISKISTDLTEESAKFTTKPTEKVMTKIPFEEEEKEIGPTTPVISEKISTGVTEESETSLDFEVTSDKGTKIITTTTLPISDSIITDHKTVLDISTPQPAESDKEFITTSKYEPDVTETEEIKLDEKPTTETLDHDVSTLTGTSEKSLISESTSSTATTVSSEIITETVTTFKPVLITKEISDKESTTEAFPIDHTMAAEEISTQYKDECLVNGTSYKDAEAIKTLDPCEKCHCSSGDIVCFKILCKLPKEGCIPNFTTTLECCPTSYDCPEDDGLKSQLTTRIPQEITEKDLSTPIPISFMFSTVPTSIASTMIVTKLDETVERTKVTAEAVTEGELKTSTDRDIISTVQDVTSASTSIKTSDETKLDEGMKISSTELPVTKTPQVISETTSAFAESSEVSTLLSSTLTEESKLEDKVPITTEKHVITSEEYGSESTSEEPMKVSMEETTITSEKDVARDDAEITTQKTVKITTLRDERVTGVTKITTETPTTFDTIKTTFALTPDDKEEITISSEMTTITSPEIDMKITTDTSKPEIDVHKFSEEVSTTETASEDIGKTIREKLTTSTVAAPEITFDTEKQETEHILSTTSSTPSSKTDEFTSPTIATTESAFDVKKTEKVFTSPSLITTETVTSTEAQLDEKIDKEELPQFTSATSKFDLGVTETEYISSVAEGTETASDIVETSKEIFTSTETPLEVQTEKKLSSTTHTTSKLDLDVTEKEYESFTTVTVSDITEMSKEASTEAPLQVKTEKEEFPSSVVTTIKTDLGLTEKEYISSTLTTEPDVHFDKTTKEEFSSSTVTTEHILDVKKLQTDFSPITVEATQDTSKTEEEVITLPSTSASLTPTDGEKKEVEEDTQVPTITTETSLDAMKTVKEVRISTEVTTEAILADEKTPEELALPSVTITTLDDNKTEELTSPTPITTEIIFDAEEVSKDILSLTATETGLEEKETSKEKIPLSTLTTSEMDLGIKETRKEEFLSTTTSTTTTISDTGVEEAEKFTTSRIASTKHALFDEKTEKEYSTLASTLTSEAELDIKKTEKEFISSAVATSGTTLDTEETETEKVTSSTTTVSEKLGGMKTESEEVTSSTATSREISQDAEEIETTKVPITTSKSFTVTDKVVTEKVSLPATVTTKVTPETGDIIKESTPSTRESALYTGKTTSIMESVSDTADTEEEVLTSPTIATSHTESEETRQFSVFTTTTTKTGVETEKEYTTPPIITTEITLDSEIVTDKGDTSSTPFTNATRVDTEKTEKEIFLPTTSQVEKVTTEISSETMPFSTEVSISDKTTGTDSAVSLTTYIPSKLPKLDDVFSSTLATDLTEKVTQRDSEVKEATTTRHGISTTEETLESIYTTFKPVPTKVPRKETDLITEITKATILEDTFTSSTSSPVETDATSITTRKELLTSKAVEVTDEVKTFTTLSPFSTLTPKVISQDMSTIADDKLISVSTTSFITEPTRGREEAVSEQEELVLGTKVSYSPTSDEFKTSQPIETSPSIISNETTMTTEYSVITEILAGGETIGILDREGTVSVPEKELDISTISTPKDISEGTSLSFSTDVKQEDKELTKGETATDKIFTFVTTRFTDVTKEMPESTTAKSDKEISTTSQELSTISTLKSTEKSDEKITHLIPLTRRIDIEFETSTSERQTSEELKTTKISDISPTKEPATTPVLEEKITASFNVSESDVSIKSDEVPEDISTTIASITTSEKSEPEIGITPTEGTISTEQDIDTTDVTKETTLVHKSTILEEASTFSTTKEISIEDTNKTTDISKVTTLVADTDKLLTEKLFETTSSTPLHLDDKTTTDVMTEKVSVTTAKELKTHSPSLGTMETSDLFESTTEFVKISRATRKDVELETTPISLFETKDYSTEKGRRITEEIGTQSTETSSSIGEEFEGEEEKTTETRTSSTKLSTFAFTTSLDEITKALQESSASEEPELPLSSIESLNLTKEVTTELLAETTAFSKTSEEVQTEFPMITSPASLFVTDIEKLSSTIPPMTETLDHEVSVSDQPITNMTTTTEASSKSTSVSEEELTVKELTTIESKTKLSEEEKTTSPDLERTDVFEDLDKTTEKEFVTTAVTREDITESSTSLAEKQTDTLKTEAKKTTSSQKLTTTVEEVETMTTVSSPETSSRYSETSEMFSTTVSILPTIKELKDNATAATLQEAETVATVSTPETSTYSEVSENLTTPIPLSPSSKEPLTIAQEAEEVSFSEMATKGFKAIETTPIPLSTAYPVTESETTTVKVDEDYLIDENTCIFEGRIYQSAEQIPRADPCEFCFCFRGDIICLQQSCPPPAANCQQTMIPGYCCPRYECPVYVTSKNISQFSRRKGVTPIIIQKRIDKREIRPVVQEIKGCQVNGTFYEMGKTVTSASGPCLHCVCQEDGLMHCDPQRCKPQAPLMLKMNNSFFRRR